MAVEGSDGQQYVVLEVIQLPDNQGEQVINETGELICKNYLTKYF